MILPTPKAMGFVLSGMLLASPLFAQNDARMVESLMKLRSDVESLHAQVQDEQDSFQSSMKSLSLQKNDFEAQINRQETQLKKIEQEITQIRELIKKRSANTEGMIPMIDTAIAALNGAIAAGIPFKTELRLADLEDVKTQLEGNLITPEQALSKVWGSYDDALRMSSENGLFKQPITIGGEPRLAEVAKLGSIMLFFKLPTGEVGYAKRQGDKYVYVQEQDKERQKQILVLFDAMTKQIRTGYFTLPYAVAGGAK